MLGFYAKDSMSLNKLLSPFPVTECEKHNCITYADAAIQHCPENLESWCSIELDKLHMNMAEIIMISTMEVHYSCKCTCYCIKGACIQLALHSLISTLFDIKYSNCVYSFDKPVNKF